MTSEQPTILRLAATTPARDWARLRLTGRLDWRAAVAAAGLPAPLADLVARVVRRSRLWRSEKADLARELAAHFADGLAAGRSPEELSIQFGDSRRAARLIGRAKKRGRPLVHRAFVRTAQAIGMILLAFGLAYLILAWRFFTSEPSITRNFTAEYNEKIEQIPEADRACDLYIEAYVLAEPVPKEFVKHWPDLAPEHPRYTDALAYLESQHDAIEVLHRAGARPRMGAPLRDTIDPRILEAENARNPGTHDPTLPPSENPMLITVLLPELGHFRAMARLLTFDTHVAARAGDGARVARNLETMLAMAGHAGEPPILISQLVGIAIHALAAKTTAEIVNEHPDLLTNRQLRDLAHRHAAFMGGGIHVDLTGERWFFEDFIQRVYSDDRHGNGHVTAEGLRTLTAITSTDGLPDSPPSLLGPIAASLIADREQMTAMHERFMSLMERNATLPMWQYDGSERVDAQLEEIIGGALGRVRYMPIALLMPALDTAAQTAEHATQRRDAILAGLALELYRRDRGAYPNSLAGLVPEYLPAVPPDRFTGAPLNYALIDGQARLWSVGADRDDDNGVAPLDDRGDQFRWVPAEQALANVRESPARYDGDWVLWPLVYEPITEGEGDDDEGPPSVGAPGGGD